MKQRSTRKAATPAPLEHERQALPAASDAAATPSSERTWFLAALLALATLIAYLPALNGGPLWDDDVHFTRPELRTPAGLARIWTEPGAVQQYYPIFHTVFWLGHHLWGDAPIGYHLLNVVLHAGSALLIVRILQLLRVPGAWLAAAVWALHPVHVESVAWISELKNTLSAVGYFGAALAYLKFVETGRRNYYAFALVIFIAGLGSKTAIATLPGALLLVAWWRHGFSGWKRTLVSLSPFFALSIAAGLLTASIEKSLIGALGSTVSLTLVERCLIAGRAILFYLAKLIWPAELVFIYPRWEINAAEAWQYVFPTAALALAIALWLMRRRFRAPLVAYLYYFGTLFPALGFINLYYFRYSFVADHFQYLAAIGPIALVCAASVTGFSVLTGDRRTRGAFASVALCGLLVWVTARHAALYRDAETLWRDVIARNPQSWLANNNLGIELIRQGREGEALTFFAKAVEINPRYAESQNNLGNRLSSAGKPQEALAHLRTAVEIDPRYAEAHNNLGTTLLRLGRIDEAIASFRKAIEIDSRYAEAQNNLGTAYEQAGRRSEAAAQFANALQLRPDYAAAHHNLANHFAQSGRGESAIEHYRRALELDPRHLPSHINLGALYLALGRAEDALAQLNQAAAIDPKNADVQNNLGNTLLSLRRIEEAVTHFEAALAADADNVNAANNVAWVYATSPDPRLRNGTRAVAVAQRADALTGSSNAVIGATLAAALAEVGRFDDAIRAAERALETSPAGGTSALSAAIRQQIEQYRRGEPSRDPASAPSG
ncbi:MAG: FIG01083931: hypothetical protein [uncultured Chthoniobacterales bacterium]|uniref:Uncharacterized protein n=1 Tax=uncultured Chthoniobacterales bacterium TaxID=1836801 RepID=A0A6J4H1R5_9BACT|nr:MAG: FIG01083931: hypothetical protein [uncultured Chthoniobacterales bacterium]